MSKSDKKGDGQSGTYMLNYMLALRGAY
jgi:hypothetical protein